MKNPYELAIPLFRRISVPHGAPFWQRNADGTVARLEHPLKSEDIELVRYKFAPPLSVRDSVGESQLPDLPFKGAPSYMRSVYYFWWAFLREHEGYIAYCAGSDDSQFAEFFSAFGDVRDGNFWRWWSEGGYCLFHERASVVEALRTPPDAIRDTEELLVRISLSADVESVLDELRTLLRDRLRPSQGASTARFPVATTPYLPALHQNLMVLRCWRAHPDALNSEVADLAGLPSSSLADPADPHVRNGKSMAVSRILKRARQLVKGTGMGVFPAGQASQPVKNGNAPVAMRAPASNVARYIGEFEISRRYEEPPDGHITRSIWSGAVSAAALLPRALKDPAFIAERLALADGSAELAHGLADLHKRLRAGQWARNINGAFDPICHEEGRIIIFCPREEFSVTVPGGRPFLSLCADTDEADTFYRMLVFQNQIPLHWCVLSSLAGEAGNEARPSAAGGREFVNMLIKRLTNPRAIVLVGQQQQSAWTALEVKLAPQIQVWRPQLPTAGIRQNDPLAWAAIPRQLPARHHLDMPV